MLVLNFLRELGELRREEELELYKILDVSLDELSALGIEGVLEHIVPKYIDDVLESNLLLAAEAQLKFAHIKRDKLKQYEDAAEEYKKLWTDYSPRPDPRLNLIKLQGKYYEGLCYEFVKEDKSQKSKEAYQQALTLFKTTFQPLIDFPNTNIPHINKEVFNYSIQTATDYAKKIRVKLKEAEQKSEDKINKEDSSYASDDPDSLKKSQTEQKQLTPEEIAQKASGSTVFLDMDNGTGSGFFVGPGQIATNYHVIEGSVRGTARLVGTDREYAIIGYTAIDRDRDLAILKVRAFSAEPLVLGNSNNINVNDDIYAVGNPLGRDYLEGTVSDGKISGLREDSTRKWIQITAPITHGNSGGPVLNNKGEVIGISTAIIVDDEVMLKYEVKNSKGEEIGSVKLPRRREQNLNFAVHVDELKALLNLVGPPKPLSDLEIIY